jgi:hypothetical protein
MGRTVVFESAIQGCFWVFKEGGSYMKTVVANVIDCPELLSAETVHIFDAKAGASREPIMTPAKLILTSSTNEESFKQTSRQAGTYPFCLYPSATSDEFYNCASIFGISQDQAQEVARVFGTGAIRNLRNKAQNIEHQISSFQLSNFHMYSQPGTVSALLPSLLIAAHLPSLDDNGVDFKLAGGKGGDLEYEKLKMRYLFENACWTFSSDYVASKVLRKAWNSSQQVIFDFYLAIGDEGKSRMFANMAAQVLEFLSPDIIIESGLTCHLISNGQDLGVGSNDQLDIRKGLVLKSMPFAATREILKTCIDPTRLYNFGKVVHGFDMFMPPNYFFQITNTISGKYRHPLNLSTFLECCNSVDQDVNLILVVEESQVPEWRKATQPWKVNVEDVVAAIKQEGPFKHNGERAFAKLPENVRNKLSKVRVFVGGVRMRRVYYSTRAHAIVAPPPFGAWSITRTVRLALKWR